jgi:hypothetical protein
MSNDKINAAPDSGEGLLSLNDAADNYITILEAALEAARDRLAEARGFIAVYAIPALEVDENMAEAVAEMRTWLEASDG